MAKIEILYNGKKEEEGKNRRPITRDEEWRMLAEAAYRISQMRAAYVAKEKEASKMRRVYTAREKELLDELRELSDENSTTVNNWNLNLKPV